MRTGLGEALTMTRVSLLVVASILLAVPGTVFPQTTQDAKAPADSLMAQLEAFRRDDYDAAFTFASEAIQKMFDRQAFEQMVRAGYPEIARSADAHVAESRSGPDGHVYLRVKVRGANGNHVEALYDMVWEGGQWRIDGVVAKRDPGLV
jgi:hypothetical protein